MDLNFYDKKGKPVAYTEDGEHIFLFSGEPVAYIDNDSVYGFNGNHFGRFVEGWIRDNKGACVFFTQETYSSGPVKPVKKTRPTKGVKKVKPIKSVKKVRPVRPINSMKWSIISPELFFKQ